MAMESLWTSSPIWSRFFIGVFVVLSALQVELVRVSAQYGATLADRPPKAARDPMNKVLRPLSRPHTQAQTGQQP